ncbi:sialoadhesin-like [Megalops cyprinoides]|uniref:sialoadhesin-like n=1 Tax=Megalops cyprinoides TaxID=118141 RepID=UPI001865105F|nr:sialoadhesin-like [Megalops cyprinoides]
MTGAERFILIGCLLQGALSREITGDLLKKNCTTVLDNIPADYSDNYFFRFECPNDLKWYFGSSIRIDVTDSPPKPKLTPVKVEVTEGTSVSLTCSAAAPCPKLPPTLTWTPRLNDSVDQLQENEDQTKSVSSVLTFTASHLLHGQKISCTALYKLQQGDGEKKSEQSLTVNVLYSPKNTSASVSASGSVMLGSSVTLTCSSNANPPVQSYTWYKVNGTEMQTVGSGQNLTFNETEPSDSGQYYCEAQNDHGMENSTTVSLDVTYSPKNTSASVSASGSVMLGSSVTLTCSSNANPPVQSYTWYKVNGTEMQTVGSGQNLTFNETEPSDSGQYYCEAQNDHGMENSTTVSLDVTYPPKSTSASLSPSGSVMLGSSVTLTCSSNANPPVQSYTWYKVNGKEMQTVGSGQNLTFNETEPSDSGQYYCEAQTDHGMENSTTVSLDVKYLPQISASQSCIISAAGISCSCESRGNPSPSMEWRVSGVRVTNSTDRVIREEQLGSAGLRSSLTMRHSERDTLTLLCLSTNTLGSSSLQLHLPCSETHSGCPEG